MFFFFGGGGGLANSMGLWLDIIGFDQQGLIWYVFVGEVWRKVDVYTLVCKNSAFEIYIPYVYSFCIP